MHTYQVQTESLFGRPDDPERADRIRTIVLPSGNKAHMKAEDPYGFIRINFDKYNTPEQLKGVYTSFNEAEKAINAYINARQHKAELELEAKRVSKYQKKVVLTPRVKDNDQADDS